MVKIFVISNCPYCDTLLKDLPKLIKQFPDLSFEVECVTKSDFEVFPTVVIGETILSPCIYSSKIEEEVKRVFT